MPLLKLISDLIALHHPLILEIRWQFHLRVSEALGYKPWNSRKEWEDCIRSYDYDLSKFFNTILTDKRFRERIIVVLQNEKIKLKKEGKEFSREGLLND